MDSCSYSSTRLKTRMDKRSIIIVIINCITKIYTYNAKISQPNLKEKQKKQKHNSINNIVYILGGDNYHDS